MGSRPLSSGGPKSAAPRMLPQSHISEDQARSEELANSAAIDWSPSVSPSHLPTATNGNLHASLPQSSPEIQIRVASEADHASVGSALLSAGVVGLSSSSPLPNATSAAPGSEVSPESTVLGKHADTVLVGARNVSSPATQIDPSNPHDLARVRLAHIAATAALEEAGRQARAPATTPPAASVSSHDQKSSEAPHWNPSDAHAGVPSLPCE